jgi:hypothetical protein
MQTVSWRPAARTREDVERLQAWYRKRGFDDGYAGRQVDLTSQDVTYRTAYRWGQRARKKHEKEEGWE